MHDLRRPLIFAMFTSFAFGVCASLPVDDESPSEPQNEPKLRLVGFARGDRFFYAVTQFSNRTMQPIYFYGHHPEVPMQSLERRGGTGWQDCGAIWCGSGAETHELKPGESIQLRTPIARLDRDEEYESIRFRTIDRKSPLRVRTHYGFAGEHAITPVWSHEFQYPSTPIATASELAH